MSRLPGILTEFTSLLCEALTHLSATLRAPGDVPVCEDESWFSAKLLHGHAMAPPGCNRGVSNCGRIKTSPLTGRYFAAWVAGSCVGLTARTQHRTLLAMICATRGILIQAVARIVLASHREVAEASRFAREILVSAVSAWEALSGRIPGRDPDVRKVGDKRQGLVRDINVVMRPHPRSVNTATSAHALSSLNNQYPAHPPPSPQTYKTLRFPSYMLMVAPPP